MENDDYMEHLKRRDIRYKRFKEIESQASEDISNVLARKRQREMREEMERRAKAINVNGYNRNGTKVRAHRKIIWK